MKISSCGTISGTCETKPASGAGSWPVTIQGWFSRALDQLAQWRGRAVERRQLNELNDRLLSDIGLTRIDARRESSKPFWQA